MKQALVVIIFFAASICAEPLDGLPQKSQLEIVSESVNEIQWMVDSIITPLLRELEMLDRELWLMRSNRSLEEMKKLTNKAEKRRRHRK